MIIYDVIVPVELSVSFKIEAEDEEHAYALLEDMQYNGELAEKVMPLLKREVEDGFWDESHYYIREA